MAAHSAPPLPPSLLGIAGKSNSQAPFEQVKGGGPLQNISFSKVKKRNIYDSWTLADEALYYSTIYPYSHDLGTAHASSLAFGQLRTQAEPNPTVCRVAPSPILGWKGELLFSSVEQVTLIHMH